MTITEIIAELKAARIKQGLTRRQVFKKLGGKNKSDWTPVKAWELCRHMPSLSTFLEWAKILGYEVVLMPKVQMRYMDTHGKLDRTISLDDLKEIGPIIVVRKDGKAVPATVDAKEVHY